MDLIIDSNAFIDLIKLELINVITRLPRYKFHVLKEVYKEIKWLNRKKFCRRQ